MGKELLILMKESTLTQGTIALIITLTICYMYATGQSVPNELITILTLILGFYFGTKTQARIMKG